MTELVFRSARLSDVASIVELLADDPLGSFRETPRDIAPYLQAFADVDGNPHQVLVVGELGDAVVATAQVSFMPGLSHRGMRRAEIEAVRVRADHRGSGIGQQLIGHCIDLARERTCGLVQLTSNAARHDARRFYEHLGFTPSHLGFKLNLDTDHY